MDILIFPSLTSLFRGEDIQEREWAGMQASQDNAAISRCSIYKVPYYLREGDYKAYAPRIVSVGPYHHGKKGLLEMDRHKWRALHHVLKRTKHDINLYLDAVKKLEKKARACYQGQSITSLGSNEFVEMMVLDGCFVTEVFRGAAEGLTKSNLKLPLPCTFQPLSDGDDLHCLAVLRGSLLQRRSQEEMKRWLLPFPRIDKTGERACTPWSDEQRQQLIHCVTELREAGIKFKRKKTDRFWDIEFKNGILYIPRLLIHDGTRSLLLNLMAFELCHRDCGDHITAYVVFMDNLINSHQDVAHLHYCGIIKHWLGSDSEVFEINESYLSHLSGDVNRYYENKWNAWRASLRHTYFSNPWAIISLAAAVFLLLLTFAQTFYGIFGYYKPR
ncbi:upf0481 protein [Quercus suber]|uniref:Upf0481 protein n=1 Tax=Quercus suber TaxID=58331 RepID=A0AAW0LLE0_QUESU